MSHPGLPGWLSLHLFYHGDRDRLLLELLRPLVSKLLSTRQIDQFFFVRFALGGPHIRLRLHPLPGCAEEVTAEVEGAAAEFFARCPSTESLDEESIRRVNRSILATDPSEEDDLVCPDNTVRAFPFRPEVSRYGGPELLGASLEFFTISSVLCLRFLNDHGAEPWPRRSTRAFRILARLGLGLARDPEEFQTLVEYPVASWGKTLQPIVDEGDRVFERQREVFCRLLRVEIDALASPGWEMQAAWRLALEIGQAPTPVRRSVATSQLHMTANRLGLGNPEEVYLGRALWRAAGAFAETEPELWKRLRAMLERRPVEAGAWIPMTATL